jgi:hypothetical protein
VQRALEVFEAEWHELVGQPSTITMPDDAAAIADRAALLDDTVQTGSTKDYKGLRVSLKGKPFEICEATLWNIISPKGASQECCLLMLSCTSTSTSFQY